MFINKKLIFLNLIPLMITLLFSVLWFADRTADRVIVNYVSYIQIILEWFGFPLFLLFINGYFHKKYQKYLFIDKIVFMLINLFIINQLHFYSASISSSLLNITDRQSSLLPMAGWQVPLHFILTGGAIVQVVLIIEWFISKSE